MEENKTTEELGHFGDVIKEQRKIDFEKDFQDVSSPERPDQNPKQMDQVKGISPPVAVKTISTGRGAALREYIRMRSDLNLNKDLIEDGKDSSLTDQVKGISPPVAVKTISTGRGAALREYIRMRSDLNLNKDLIEDGKDSSLTDQVKGISPPVAVKTISTGRGAALREYIRMRSDLNLNKDLIEDGKDSSLTDQVNGISPPVAVKTISTGRGAALREYIRMRSDLNLNKDLIEDGKDSSLTDQVKGISPPVAVKTISTGRAAWREYIRMQSDLELSKDLIENRMDSSLTGQFDDAEEEAGSTSQKPETKERIPKKKRITVAESLARHFQSLTLTFDNKDDRKSSIPSTSSAEQGSPLVKETKESISHHIPDKLPNTQANGTDDLSMCNSACASAMKTIPESLTLTFDNKDDRKSSMPSTSSAEQGSPLVNETRKTHHIQDKLPWLELPSREAIGAEHIRMYMAEEVHNLETMLDSFTTPRKVVHDCILQIAECMLDLDPSRQKKEVDHMFSSNLFSSCDKIEQSLLTAVQFCLAEIFGHPNEELKQKLPTINHPEDWALLYIKAKVMQMFGSDGCRGAIEHIQKYLESHGNTPEDVRKELQILKIRILAKLTDIKQLPSNKWAPLLDELSKLPQECLRSKFLSINIMQAFNYRYFLENKHRAVFRLSSDSTKYVDSLQDLKTKLLSLTNEVTDQHHFVWCVEQMLLLPILDSDIQSPSEKILEIQELFHSRGRSFEELSSYFLRVAARIRSCFAKEIEEKYKDAIEILNLAIQTGSQLAVLEIHALKRKANKRYVIPFTAMYSNPNGKLHHAAFLGFICRQDKAAYEILVGEFLKYPSSPEMHAFRSPFLGLKEPICLMQLLHITKEKEVLIPWKFATSECGKSSYLSLSDNIPAEANRLLHTNNAFISAKCLRSKSLRKRAK